MLIFDSLMFLDIKPICWRFIARILRFVSCSFLAIRVLSPFTLRFWSHYLSCWEGLLLSQNHASGADWFRLCLVKLLAMYLTHKRTGSQEGCSHYKNKLSIRLASSSMNVKMHYQSYWLATQLVLTYVLKYSEDIRRRLYTAFVCIHFWLWTLHHQNRLQLGESLSLSTGLSSLGAFLGFLPARISRFLAKKILGKSCSSSTVEILCTHVLKYHVMRNMLFMAKTEFEKLPQKPDFDFIGENKSKLAFLFGSHDHWGPLHLYEEIQSRVPDATLAIECEGHTHAFSCTDAGSIWVAQHVRSLIKNHLPK